MVILFCHAERSEASVVISSNHEIPPYVGMNCVKIQIKLHNLSNIIQVFLSKQTLVLRVCLLQQ